MNRSKLVALLSVGIFSIFLGRTVAEEANWPQFRGPNGSGVAGGQRPPVVFNKDTNVLWSVPVPSGASSPCIWNDRIILTGFAETHLLTLCYRRGDGHLLWQQVAPAEKLEDYHPQEGTPAASTAVTDGHRVYVYFGSCGLLCYDLNGVEQWRQLMPPAETFGGFGTGTSPVLADGLVIISRNQRDGPKLVAVDAATGQRAWVKQGFDMFGWCTPAVWDQGPRKELVIPVACTIVGYDVKTGSERWNVRGIASATCSTPVVGPDLLFVSSWSPLDASNAPPPYDGLLEALDKNKDGVLDLAEVKGNELERMFPVLDTNQDQRLTRAEYEKARGILIQSKNALLAIKPGGSGDCTATHVAWKQGSRGLPYVSSPLLYENRIYVVKDGGLASCFDASTGRPVYLQERLGVEGSFYSSPVAADHRIYAGSTGGVIVVFQAGDSLNVLARNHLSERMTATPAIVENTLYLRTAARLWAFKDR